MAKPDPRTTCDSCGTWTGMDTHCCGRCAEDFNDRDREAGTRRINGRRRVAGLPLLDSDRNVSRTIVERYR